MPEIKTDPNLGAFLDTLAWSEGTDNGRQITANRGYDVIVGGQLFTDYSKHPGVLVKLPKLGISSTAAGRYQHLHRYWLAYRKLLDLDDFSPLSQDRIAIQQIKECKALPLIAAGNLEAALHACRRIWASLPGAGYGQHEQSFEKLKSVYLRAGGSLS